MNFGSRQGLCGRKIPHPAYSQTVSEPIRGAAERDGPSMQVDFWRQSRGVNRELDSDTQEE